MTIEYALGIIAIILAAFGIVICIAAVCESLIDYIRDRKEMK